MKAVVYYDRDDIRYTDWEDPGIGPQEILVAMRACGLCGTDLSKIRNRRVKGPAILGHELAGEIEKVGSQVTAWRPGQRVFVGHHVPCFFCHSCRHGNFSQCLQFRETNIDPGGFAEKVRIKRASVERATFLIPEHLSYEEASLAETVACCLRGINRSGIQVGETVAIVGGGPVGLIHLQLAIHAGAAKVVVTDREPGRLQAAQDFGARGTIDITEVSPREGLEDLGMGEGVDQVIVAAGSVEAIRQAIELAGPGGRINIFAECPPNSLVEIDPNLIYHSEVSIIGTYSSTPREQREALELIANGRIKAKELITHRFPLARFGEALAKAQAAKEALKIVLTP